MNFGDFLDNSTSDGGGVIIVTNSNDDRSNNNNNNNMSISTNSPSLAKSMFNSPRLSLALQTGREGQGGIARMPVENCEANNNNNSVGRRSREEEEESRSGSENLEGGSGEDEDITGKPQRKRKKYHRHTPQQIQELEALFKECPHPDEKQRMELSRRLCLETRQVKFWFQNRRTQMKTQLERHENSFLRQENDKLRAENMSIREAIRNPICTTCSGPSIIGEVSLEEQHLRIENSRLKDELNRVCALANKFLGRPISSMASVEVGNDGFRVPTPDFGVGISSPLSLLPHTRQSTGINEMSFERSVYLDLALAAMDELIKMAQTDDPLWVRNRQCGGEVLNHEEYIRAFTPCIGLKPINFVSEASREIGMVIINSLALVETLMDSNKWAEMFPCLIARTSTTDVISTGVGGTRNGALQLMSSELQVLSPLVPIREFKFLRFCKQHVEGVWAVVDVSIDTIRETASGAAAFTNCRRLPSGCVVQDMPNGYSKITWVEHVEYDESVVHQLYRPLISAGMGFGAQKWVATLQRQCECLAILMSSAVPSKDHTALTPSGRRSMLKLAQRMTNNFCTGVCASSIHKWNKLCVGNVDDNVRVLTRKSVDDPGEPPGIVVSAATSVWLPISPQRLFDFLRDERLRSEWDILSNGGPMQEMAHIAKGQDRGNCVSLLRASVMFLTFSSSLNNAQNQAMNASQSSMLILQETCIDASGALVVYAPVDIPAMHLVMNGGDSSYVALLPSGFSILPDGPGSHGPSMVKGLDNGPGPNKRASGSLLTIAFQILVNSLPTAKLTVESVETVNNLISCTVQKIKAALHCES